MSKRVRVLIQEIEGGRSVRGKHISAGAVDFDTLVEAIGEVVAQAQDSLIDKAIEEVTRE